jgi:hypothetical protein
MNRTLVFIRGLPVGRICNPAAQLFGRITNPAYVQRLALSVLVAVATCAALGCPNTQQTNPSATVPSTAQATDDSQQKQQPAPTVKDNGDKKVDAAAVDEPHSQQPTQTPAATNDKPPEQPAVVSPTPPNENNKPATSDTAAPPEKFREPLFTGWPKPLLALFITGRQNGYIEPCGCTGLANQKGGLSRRHTLQKQLIEQGWPLVAIDVGNQVHRFGRQPEIKFQITVEGLKTMGYRAVALGPDDLRLSVGELVAATTGSDEMPSPFVCANAAVLDPDLTPRHHVITAGGKKIGVTAVLGEDERKKITSDEIILKSAADGLSDVWPKLEAQQCDLYVLLAHASIDESKELAKKFPHFDVVVTAGGAGEPTLAPEPIEGCKSVLVQVGTKGMYVGVLGVFDDANQRLRYQRVPLDDRFADSADMLALLASYQDQLKEIGLDGLGLRPIPHPSGRTFVGSETCGECHTKAMAVWEKTPHAHATDSIAHPTERSEIQRHFDPECLSCHVTGWNAQKYFPYTSGYLGLSQTPKMRHNGCENCHGPGSAHVAAETGDVDASAAELKKLRESMRLTLEQAKTNTCMECHDLDNSPDFHKPGAWEKYWDKVKHYGKD